MIELHNHFRSAVLSLTSCAIPRYYTCGLTLGGQMKPLSVLMLQLSHHLVAEEVQITKTQKSSTSWIFFFPFGISKACFMRIKQDCITAAIFSLTT